MTRARTIVPPTGSAAVLPTALVAELRSLDRRVLPRDLEDLVVRLCTWKPLPLREIARLLRRDDIYLQNTVIKRLLADGRLGFLHRGRPNHPRQAYVAGKPRLRRAPGMARPVPPLRPERTIPVEPAPEAIAPIESLDIGRND